MNLFFENRKVLSTLFSNSLPQTTPLPGQAKLTFRERGRKKKKNKKQKQKWDFMEQKHE